jgi:hypothetical protein
MVEQGLAFDHDMREAPAALMLGPVQSRNWYSKCCSLPKVPRACSCKVLCFVPGGDGRPGLLTVSSRKGTAARIAFALPSTYAELSSVSLALVQHP